MDAAINVENLTVNYGDKTIIHNFNIKIPHNSLLVIVGHNGCGKSTLLKTLANLQNPTNGKISILGKEINTYTNIYKKGVLSFLSQSNQIGFDIKVKELLLMGRQRFSSLFSNYSKEDLDSINQIANELDIVSFLDKNFLELSGGEQQLVLFSQIILQEAQIILLDEPTQNLDIKNGYKLIKYLNKLVEEKDKTVIITTHDLHHLSDVNGNILNMTSGLEIEKISNGSIQKQLELLRV